jgi:hypothetical protein
VLSVLGLREELPEPPSIVAGPRSGALSGEDRGGRSAADVAGRSVVKGD